ncbi:MAG: hypothetical protein ACOCW1_02995 [Chitinispirillaceae bacterium]
MPQQAPWEQTPPAQQNSDSFQQQPYDFSPPQESQGQRGDNQSEESLPLSNYDDIFTSPEQPAAASQSSYDAEPISFEPASPYEANTDSDEIEIESFPRAGYDQSQQQPDEGELPDYNSMEYQQNQSFEQPAASDFGTGEVPQNRTDLDLEIEKYQKEIEEKQKKMRTSPGQYPDDSQEMQSFSSPADHNPYQSQSQQDYEQAEEEEEDFDVFMGPQQNGGNADSEEGDDAMYFTSIDRDRHKRPVKRPVNPKTKGQNQKGFLKKFFNKDNM